MYFKLFAAPPILDIAPDRPSSLHRKKRSSFPSLAGMSRTKLPLDRNNSVLTSFFPPRESLVVTSRLGTGNSRTFFYGVFTIFCTNDVYADILTRILRCSVRKILIFTITINFLLIKVTESHRGIRQSSEKRSVRTRDLQ